MSLRRDQQTIDQILRQLAGLLDMPVSRITVSHEPAIPGEHDRLNLLISAGGRKFALEWKASGTAAEIGMAVRRVRGFVQKSGNKKLIPLIAAPYIGDVGRELCAEAEVSWLDLSGNAHLVAPGLRVHIEGISNQFKRLGRPRSVFAPKSSRIVRCLLIGPDRVSNQRELAKTAGVDEGLTSRIVRYLAEQRLVTREPNGTVKVADSEALLTAWREAYDFSRHHIVRGHIAARSGDEVLRRLSAQLKHEHLQHATTGLAGAWLLNQFAGFRLVTCYVARTPSQEVQQAMGFRKEPRGENVWLVVPNDEGVFQGAAEREGIWCVHPVQVYLDLKAQPERSAEAAEALHRILFSKGSHAG